MSHTYLSFPAAPNLPLAPELWEPRFQEQFSNVLRLYFTQMSQTLRGMASPAGAYQLSFPHAAVSRTTDQTFTANTATLVTFDTDDYLNATTNSKTDGIVVHKTGIYNYQFSVQFSNPDTLIHDGFVWLRKNNNDIAGTASRFNVPAKHGGGDGYLIGAANFYVDLTAGDSVSLYMAVSNANVYCEAYAAQTSPFNMPSIPSVVATLSFVSAQNE